MNRSPWMNNHGLLFIHHRPPPASMCDCSSSLHRALLHRLLFNHPSTVYCSSSPPHHGVRFNRPSTGTPPPSTVHPALHHTTGSCSTIPPRPPLHCLLSSTPPPARSIGVLFIQRQHHGFLFIQPPPGTVLPPPNNAHCSSRSSIDRLQLAAVAKESLGFT